MKILFKSNEPGLIAAAKKWQKSLNMDQGIKYFELKPYIKGETPEYSEVSNPTGRAITHIELTKEGSIYHVFRHDLLGIVIARKDF